MGGTRHHNSRGDQTVVIRWVRIKKNQELTRKHVWLTEGGTNQNVADHAVKELNVGGFHSFIFVQMFQYKFLYIFIPMFGCLFLLQLQGWKLRCDLSLITHLTPEHKSLYFFSPEFPVQPVITWHPSPPPLFALWGRKQSSSDVLYGPSRLGRNQDVLLGAGMIVSALAGRFVSLQVISWMDNDRYTFPAIFHFCRRGSEKHGTLWPWGHLCKQVSRLPKLAAPRSGWHKDTFSQSAARPRGDPVTLWVLGSVSGGCKSGKLGGWGAGWWGNIEEATLDFWRVRWTLMGRRSRRMRRWWGGRRGTGRRMACGRGHSFDLWFFNFF